LFRKGLGVSSKNRKQIPRDSEKDGDETIHEIVKRIRQNHDRRMHERRRGANGLCSLPYDIRRTRILNDVSRRWFIRISYYPILE